MDMPLPCFLCRYWRGTTPVPPKSSVLCSGRRAQIQLAVGFAQRQQLSPWHSSLGYA